MEKVVLVAMCRCALWQVHRK